MRIPFLLRSLPLLATADPLPSWNATASKKAIISMKNDRARVLPAAGGDQN